MNTETKLIKNKLGLLKLAEELGNVSQACKYLGYSRVELLTLLGHEVKHKKLTFV